MKKGILLMMMALVANVAMAQLVISEISYNPPESGTDSLEYVELYNSTDATIDLTGYMITDNSKTDTLTEGTIVSGGYVVLASNPEAILEILGVTAIATRSIALNNSGEPITISNPNGNMIDMVEYSDKAPWPTFADGTDGGGSTIELCSFAGDNNNGSNWLASTNDLEITINDVSFHGTPSAENSVSCEAQADHIVEVSSNDFTPKDLVIKVGETVRWTNIEGNHNVNGTLNTYPDNPEGFGNGEPSTSNWTYDFTFNTEGVYDYQCDPHANLGMVGTVTVEGEEIDVELSSIGSVNNVDADGVAMLLGDTVRVQGVIHGENINPSGHQYAIVDVDNLEGIGIFAGDDLGYNYAEGDMIEVLGLVDQYNGLTQIAPFSISYISSDNALMEALEVDVLSEDTESLLVQLDELDYVDISQWKGDGSSFNVEYTDGTNTVLVRIDQDSELSTVEAPFPGGAIFITGIGGQFDSSSPFLDGYQLFPRKLSDFDVLYSSNDLSNEGNISLSPNPSSGYINIDTDININHIEIYSLTGQLIKSMKYNKNLDLTDLNSGLYAVKLIRDNKSTTKKIMIK